MTTSNPDFERLHGIPVDTGGPVFHVPWQAQAFAMVVHLQQQGLFSWGEWAEQLGDCIVAAKAHGDADLGDTYYDHWLAALERLLAAKGVVSPQVLENQQSAMRRELAHQHAYAHHDEHARAHQHA
jgi:nitrile hydratase accessory protein